MCLPPETACENVDANETARTVAGQQLRVMEHCVGTRQGANHSQTSSVNER